MHHLYFSEADYERRGSFIKCNPAIKRAEDRAALRRARRGSSRRDRDRPRAAYAGGKAGHFVFQYASRSAAGAARTGDGLELVHDGDLSLPRLVHKVSHGPAELFRVHERGYLRGGLLGRPDAGRSGCTAAY